MEFVKFFPAKILDTADIHSYYKGLKETIGTEEL